MSLTTKTLGNLIEKIDKEQLQLPEIQREFVWSKNSVKLLFDSLYRDLPIGQMLVWKPLDSVPASKSFAHRKKKRAPNKIDSFYGYLLDGQQRLTAIARVADADEAYPLIIDLWPDKDPDESVFYWSKRMNETSAWYVPVSDVLARDFNISAHLERLKEDKDFKPAHAELVRKALTRLQDILNYEISVIEFESDDYKKATDLFIRFNSTGKNLNRSDLALADLATRVEGITSNEMKSLIHQLAPQFRFTYPFLIQCLVAVHTGGMNLKKKPEEIWQDSTPGEIRESWRRTAKGLERTVEFLTGTVQWNSDSWIPSFNALIPLVYVLAHNRPFSLEASRLARSWLLLSSIHGYFSGSVHTELDKLLGKLKAEPSVEQLWNVTKRKLGKIRPEDFETMRRSSAVMSLFISMLRNQDARDWIKQTPLNGTVLGKHAQLHVHHFFPKALLSKHDKSIANINTFANYTILSASTNWDISTEEPYTYLARLKPSQNDLDAQCIPTLRRLLRVSGYEAFLAERKRLLAQRANEFLGL